MTLRVERLVIGRASFRAGPIGFEAAAGSVVALIGPNGGGKTTLLKTLAGLLPAVEGVVASGSPAAAAYLPPPGALSVSLAALHVVALGRAARRGWSPVLSTDDYRAAEQAMARLGVAALGGQPFDQLSSGQQQLALIARLIVQDARLCLLDEPTALLDPRHGGQVEAAVRGLAAEGRVVIASTHHLAFAARADLVIAMGPSVAVGRPEKLMTAGKLSELYGAPMASCPCCGQPTPDPLAGEVGFKAGQ